MLSDVYVYVHDVVVHLNVLFDALHRTMHVRGLMRQSHRFTLPWLWIQIVSQLLYLLEL